MMGPISSKGGFLDSLGNARKIVVKLIFPRQKKIELDIYRRDNFA